ncbi:SDR family NAD(P)-dependent oxidoreductase [Deinococcus marmoris]|uniref:Short-chain dehydrogenase/reductase SDR n=1 Tax=Deinococcus marmoris TaxID=249408 RepID=A0A1U7P133_9DEIO|nr:SDR family NAD(P)-dependent oxidoreductase [Deinococcus marmoris]OLV18874.1 Short-chain dehydrogenase/reductase SDR [Deinococcus marmoris]
MDDFKGKVALVTGANKGLGKQLVRRLLDHGWTVYLGSRDLARGKAAVDELQGPGRDVRLLVLDVTDGESVTQAVSHIEQGSGLLDLLVNNAGISVGGHHPSQTDIEDVRAVFETNFFGPFRLSQAMLPLLRKSETPSIINVSSDLGSMGLIGYPDGAHARTQLFAYQSSKVAQNGLTVLLAKDLYAEGIRVNAVNPGFTATDITGFRGDRTVEVAVEESLLKYALQGKDGPTGGFFTGRGSLPW